MATINLEKHIWEGWRVIDFINELEPILDNIMKNHFGERIIKNKTDLKKWCIENQPYYKKYIPGVVNYFANEYNLK